MLNTSIYIIIHDLYVEYGECEAAAACCATNTMAESEIIGVLTASGSEVRGALPIRQLHKWSLGGFGELVVERHDGIAAATGRKKKAKLALPNPDNCTLVLSAVESFFLLSASNLPKLHLRRPDAGQPASSTLLGDHECWSTFCHADPMFPQLYVAYRALRNAGWCIRDGLKFGVDFLLYDPHSGPEAHSSYGVLVNPPQHTCGERDWLWLQQRIRLTQQTSKALLLCSVDSPTDLTGKVTPITPSSVDNLEVRTVMLSAWSPGKEHASL